MTTTENPWADVDTSSWRGHAEDMMRITSPRPRPRDQELPRLERAFEFDPAADAALAEHLAGTVERAQAALAQGQRHQPTEEAVQALADLAEAVAGGAPVRISLRLGPWQAAKVTALLAGSLERARKLDATGPDPRRGLERLLAAWKRATKTDDREVMLARPDVTMLPDGGRSDVKADVKRWQETNSGREVGTPHRPAVIDSTTYPDADGRIWD